MTLRGAVLSESSTPNFCELYFVMIDVVNAPPPLRP